MRTNKNIDQGLRHLEATSLILPSESVWGNIQNELDGKSNKKVGWIWTISLLVIASTIGIIWSPWKSSEVSSKIQTTGADIDLVVADDFKTEKAAKNLPEETNAVGFVVDKQKVESFNEIEPVVKHEKSINEYQTETPESNETFTIAEIEGKETETETETEVVPEVSAEAEKPVIDQNLPPVTSTPEVEKVATNIPQSTEDLLPEDDPCPAMDNKIKKAVFVELGGLLGSHLKNFTTMDEGLAMYRDQTEQAWYTWGGYAGLGIFLKPNMYINTNVEMVQQKDLFNYSREGISRLIVEYDPATGEQLSSHTVSGSWNSQGEVKRTTIDGSLNFGYLFGNNKPLNNSWQIGVEPGLVYNFDLTTSGKVMTDENEISRLENENLYRNSLGLGYQAQLIFIKHLENGLQLNFKPFYRNYLDAWSTANSEELSIASYGVKFGLRKQF